MILTNPDARRALRAMVEAVATLALLAIVWRIVSLLADNPAGLTSIAHAALAIIAIGALFYGAENGIRAARISAFGVSGEMTSDAPAAARVVAGAAEEAAAEIEEQGP